jgi:16S rRNA (cytosine967-C5)-methyltransferase
MDPGSVVWDCCSGSGGKSILLYDSLPGIILTASDKRESIIVNLKTRFREAGIRQYKALVLDLEKETLPGNIRFDLIMADVPCTGSGTWSRTPEQLYFHEPSAIAKYQLLQRKIVERIIPSLKKGNQLLYITCSVFRQENEENIKWAEEKFGLTTKKLDTIRGYTLGADTMFAALLTL